jgi:hypothetical protein
MVNQSDKIQIEEMYQYLLGEGYNVNKLIDGKIISNKTNKELLDLTNSEKVLEKIIRNDVSIIHNPIKNTLIEYYRNKQKASTNIKVRVILTKNFELVWERIIQEALNHSEKFKEDKSKLFKDMEIFEDFIPSSKVSEYQLEIIEDDTVPENSTEWIVKRNGMYFHCIKERKLIPDIFVQLPDKRRFLGDAKYYKDASNSNYDKEFYIYNDAQNNEYPMVIFAIPDSGNIDKTMVPRNGLRRARNPEGGYRELIIITVCVEDVINYALDSTDKVLKKSIDLITKYTRKESWRNS